MAACIKKKKKAYKCSFAFDLQGMETVYAECIKQILTTEKITTM